MRTEIAERIEPLYRYEWIVGVVEMLGRGKEAETYLCQAHPRRGMDFVVVKVYRPRDRRGFQNDAKYREGRPIGSRTARKAMEQKSRFGRKMLEATWVDAEYQRLKALWAAGLPVPEPYAVADEALVMEFLGDSAGAAPLLKDVEPDASELPTWWDSIVQAVAGALTLHVIHADLSPYNILIHQSRPWLIDWPQAVDARHNRHAQELLIRDLNNIGRYFASRGLALDVGALAAELWTEYWYGRL